MLNNQNLFKQAYIEDKNEELSQALSRLILVTIFVSYYFIMEMMFNEEDFKFSILILAASLMLYAFIHLLWVKRSSKKNHLRRLVGAIVDIGAVTLGLYLLEWLGLIVFSVYIWIIVGYGMRFGIKYLFTTMLLTLIGFGTILCIHPFWIANRDIGLGLASMLILLPLFFLVMINRLKAINSKLKEQLEIQKRQEIILLQQSRHAAMGEMISNIAHQWRQPLNAVGLIFQNIENTYEMDMLDEKYLRRTIGKGMKLTASMSKTIDDFRDFFKPNKQKELFSINEAIQSSLEIIEMNLKQNNIEVNIELKNDCSIDGYKNEFSQVLLNILGNAKDVLMERKIQNPEIMILAYIKNEKIIIEISDNGQGISEDVITHIFDPYFTTKEHIDGTGIGLYMSKLIVEDHLLGKLDVQNSLNGAMFKITLPSSTLNKESDYVEV